MDSSLLENINSEEFANENLLTGRPNQVHVLVEDEEDVRFWRDLLKYSAPDKDYEINPFETDSSGNISTTKGKDHLLQDTSRYGKTFIACVDSDYDFLLSDTSSYGQALQCPYVIQTHVYSFENFTCDSGTLNEVCSYTSACNSNYDFVSFCSQLSSILYPLLKWSLYFCSINKDDEFKVNSAWRSVLPSDEGTDKKTEKELLDKVSELVNQKIYLFQKKYPNIQQKVDALAQVLNTRFGLNSGNAIEYVQGHALFNYILNVLVKPEHGRLRNAHINQIKNSFTPPQTKLDDLICHYKKSCRDCEQMLKDNFRYKTTNIHVKDISKKIRDAVA